MIVRRRSSCGRDDMTMTGGEKMKSFLEKLLHDLTYRDTAVRVGFLENSTCGIKNDQPAPKIAFILEQGAPAAGIPPRPFFRNMITRYKMTWGGTLADFLKANHYDKHKALLGTGIIMAEQLQLEITETKEPRDKDWAIKAKGHTKPLEWSKNMKRAVAAEVDGERINGKKGE